MSSRVAVTAKRNDIVGQFTTAPLIRPVVHVTCWTAAHDASAIETAQCGLPNLLPVARLQVVLVWHRPELLRGCLYRTNPVVDDSADVLHEISLPALLLPLPDGVGPSGVASCATSRD